MDSGRKNGKSAERLECSDAAVGKCGNRPDGFQSTYSYCKYYSRIQESTVEPQRKSIRIANKPFPRCRKPLY